MMAPSVRKPRLPAGRGGVVPLELRRWYRVDVVLGAMTAADTCGFSLGVPIKAQAPSTLRSLVSLPVALPARGK